MLLRDAGAATGRVDGRDISTTSIGSRARGSAEGRTTEEKVYI
jgi:hypothetical protein